MLELISNYLFAILQPFSKDGWKILSIISLFFIFKYWKFWKKDNIIIPIIIFLCYDFISSLFSPYKNAAFKELTDYIVSWLFAFVLGYSITKTKDKINLIKVYIVIFIVILIAGFLAYFNIIPSQIGYMHLVEYKRIWVFDGHTILGARCNFVIIPCIVLFFFHKNIKQNIMILLTALYFTFALLLSGTRNCYISLFITFLFIFLFYIYKSKNFLKGICLLSALLICFLVTYLYNPFIKNRINKTSIKTESSLIERIDMYKFGLRLIKEKPIFGHTPKTATNMQEKITVLPHFHNIYLDMWVNFGIIGLILFLIIIYNIFRRLIIAYIQTKSLLPLMLIFAWIAIMLSECFDCFLKTPYAAGLYFWVTGLILDNDNLVKNAEKE